MNQQNIFQGLQPPKSNTQEVLLTLILQGEVSIMDFPYLSGFRTRVSEIRNKYGLRLTQKMVLKKNKYGNTFSYANHILNDNNKQKAIELYKEMIKQ